MDPYSAAAKLVYKAVAVALLVCLFVYGYQRIQVLTVQRDAARGEAEQLAHEIEVQQQNAVFSAELSRRALERAVARSKGVERVKGGIVHADVPEACKAALAPIRSARLGLLELEAAELRIATTPGLGLRAVPGRADE